VLGETSLRAWGFGGCFPQEFMLGSEKLVDGLRRTPAASQRARQINC
jgi:hypothetical protein